MDSNDHDMAMDGEDHAMQDVSGANGFVNPRDLTNPTDSNSLADYDDALDSDISDDYQDVPFVDDALAKLRQRRMLPTGVCYDERMKFHANADWSGDKHHPEDPRRIGAIFETFKKAGLVFHGSREEEREAYIRNPTQYMWRIPCREAFHDELQLAHLPKHVAWVEGLQDMTTVQLRELTKQLDSGRESLYVGALTYLAALLSAGGAIDTCLKVVEGEDVKNAFAVIRPPGHHAEYDCSMGFCIFNNVAVAAKNCQQRYPDRCRKVMILDWDVHHGNGIQNMFYKDPNVLYISIHVYQDGKFYPGQPENDHIPDGGPSCVGSDEGTGFNVNIPWHDQGMGDGEYMAAFQEVVMPIGKEFNPDLVIISAGFDAADGDELGGCFVSPACYAHMTHMLMSLANGKVAVCLEGGYNLRAISASALEVARTLMGEPPPPINIPKINAKAARDLVKVKAHHAPYWQCMRQGIVDVGTVDRVRRNGGERLHDVIRISQRTVLHDQFRMFPIFIQRSGLYKSLEDQVMVTRDIHDAKRLIIIIHDPPEVYGQSTPSDITLETHNSFVNDAIPEYIEWAIKSGFGVMEINLPHYVTRPEDFNDYSPRNNEDTLQELSRELMCYIWDNYLQIHEKAQEIFLVGGGNAYMGVKMLLIHRECKSRLSGVINFVTGSLRPIKSDADHTLSQWYKENSLVYVAHDHLCWADEQTRKKIRKPRFGNIMRSEEKSLAEMMRRHKDAVASWVAGRSNAPVIQTNIGGMGSGDATPGVDTTAVWGDGNDSE